LFKLAELLSERDKVRLSNVNKEYHTYGKEVLIPFSSWDRYHSWLVSQKERLREDIAKHPERRVYPLSKACIKQCGQTRWRHKLCIELYDVDDVVKINNISYIMIEGKRVKLSSILNK